VLGICTLGLAGPVLAGTAATLTVSVRVVERCAVRLPDRVPDHVWARLPAPARARLAGLVEHHCAPRTPARVHLAPGPPPGLAPPRPPGRAVAAPRGPNQVLVTITY
jgi:hypothetical protein